MQQSLIIILYIVQICLLSILLARFLLDSLRHQTQIHQHVFIIFLIFGFGIIFEYLRISYFFIFGPIDEFIYRICFYLNCLFIFLSISIALRAMFIFYKQSGNTVKHERYIRIFYSVLPLALSVLNMFTYYKTDVNEFGYYTYQLHPIFYLLIPVFYAPLLIFILIKTKEYLYKIQNKKLTNQMLQFTIIFAFIIIERVISLGMYFILPNSRLTIIADLLVLSFLLTMSLIVLLKNPEFLENISTYFNVKSIYFIKKTGGQLLYSYNFESEQSVMAISPNQFLLGGFIHAVTLGLEQLLKDWGKMETIKVGDTFLLFKDGKYVLGIIFTTQVTPMLHLKLLMLMQKFEQLFEKSLQNWTGILKEFESDQIKNWIIENFR